MELLSKEELAILIHCGLDIEATKTEADIALNRVVKAFAKIAGTAYVRGHNDAIATDAKGVIIFDDLKRMACERQIEHADMPDAEFEEGLPDGTPEAAEIEAEKSCKTCIASDKCFGAKHNVVCDKYHEQGIAVGFGLGDAKKEARAGFFSMQDYRHALASPGVTMCGGDATVNIEITEGARVNCPLCLEAIEDEEKQS